MEGGPFAVTFTGVLAFILLGGVLMLLGGASNQDFVLRLGEWVAFAGIWLYLLRFMPIHGVMRLLVMWFGLILVALFLIP